MQIEEMEMQGVFRLVPARFGDSRGWFSESWNRKRLSEAGINAEFVQDNRSWSAEAGTLRGLHFQSPPHAQAKLVQVLQGEILDVVVDLRRSSASYGRWTGVGLSAETGAQLFIPAGFAHGFVTRREGTEILYKCTDYYAPAHEGAIRFDDPDLGIDWGIDPARAILSDKDARAGSFADLHSPFA
ncbi:dTDP-4-dehydrorhamnose 3,5-epimerase [Szabonella alba]|uniref:dTDP-4-dehydrorhamnose 3,5-epimerase n=1 Tax=Szabonella alba TaxID=2804194 RepID=A0A8K0Y2G4_9RHOB|nr:dTDP-4-dehydrorhamnose 3,5-epimerase [Szabonella alba]MBL4919337.1 dTDP-4-dehydrorhamnose 3,5-epimerase [Szabonella alba]